jgi:hypothetical protein
MSKFYGEHITPVLKEISDSMWEIDARDEQQPYEYGDSALNSGSKIMMSVCVDKMWSNFEKAGTNKKLRLTAVEAFGDDLRQLIIKHLGVDPHEEIKKEFK